jgi:hypothetical protein
MCKECVELVPAGYTWSSDRPEVRLIEHQASRYLIQQLASGKPTCP